MPETDRRPNILFFFSDQQRWDTVGCYGQPMEVTPNLDRLAAEGVRFEYAFTCQPVCGPARACLQTGRYATETGCFRNWIALPAREKTIAHRFSEAGYEVAYLGKWHLASTGLTGTRDVDFQTKPVPPERRGGWKDFWLAADTLEFTSHGYDGYLYDGDMNRVDFTGYRVDALTDFAGRYLRGRKSDRPFFLFLSYIEPHHQNDRKRYEGPIGSKERFKDFAVPGDLAGLPGDWPEQYPDYLGCCASLDGNLGRLRRELETLGLADNTLIIYTSDHGSHFRTRNDEYKRSCHDGCIRIPLIVYGPGFRGGKVIDELVSLIDLPPTLLRAGGIEIPPAMRGRPIQDLTQDAARDWPREVFLQISETQVGRAIRTHRWKYAVIAPGKDGLTVPSAEEYTEAFLYDLETDPHERRNRVADPACRDVRRCLAEVLKRRMVQAGEAEPVIHPAPATTEPDPRAARGPDH